jgi:hypothetical protein
MGNRCGDRHQRIAHFAPAPEVSGEPPWADQLAADSPGVVWVTGLGVDGAAIRVQQRVQAGAQTAVDGELRRRLAAAFAASNVTIGRWDSPLTIAGIAGDPTP